MNLSRKAKLSLGSMDAFRDGEFQDYPVRYNTINGLIEDALTMTLVKDGKRLIEKDLYTLARLFEIYGSYFPNPLLPHGLEALKELNQVDFVLSFRVLECGVRYVDLEEKLHDHYSQVDRLALTKIHLRLIDTKSGAIKWSDILSGTARATTPTLFLSQAESGQYRFFNYTYPARTKDALEGGNLFPPFSQRKKPEKPSLVEQLVGKKPSEPKK